MLHDGTTVSWRFRSGPNHLQGRIRVRTTPDVAERWDWVETRAVSNRISTRLTRTSSSSWSPRYSPTKGANPTPRFRRSKSLHSDSRELEKWFLVDNFLLSDFRIYKLILKLIVIITRIPPICFFDENSSIFWECRNVDIRVESPPFPIEIRFLLDRQQKIEYFGKLNDQSCLSWYCGQFCDKFVDPKNTQ